MRINIPAILLACLVIQSCSSFDNLLPAKQLMYNQIQWDASTISCKFIYGQLMGFEPVFTTENVSKLTKDTFDCPETDAGCKVIFSDLNSDNPQIMSSDKGSISIGRKGKELHDLLLIEHTPTGTINLYRIDLNSGFIISTKNVTGFGSMYGAIYGGQCQKM